MRPPAVGEQFDVPHTTDVDEVLASADVDAVAICSSTDTHVPFMIAAANAGKAIFCEKPISLDLGKVDEALAVIESSGVPFQVGFNRRFDAAHASVRAAVIDGSVGDLHMVRITSRDPAPPPIPYIEVSGGIFLDMMIHDFDMARFVTGSEVVDVYAQGAVRIDPAIGEAGDVDTAVVMLRHENELHHHHRQQPPGGVRLRPASRGLRIRRHGGFGEPADPHRHAPVRGRHDQPDDSVLLPRSLHPQLRRGVEVVRRLRRQRRRLARWRPTTAEPRW